MYQKIYLIILFFLSGLTYAGQRPEIILKNVLFAKSPIEFSGLTFSNGVFYGVGDNNDDYYIYKLELFNKRFVFKKEINLSKLSGFKEYIESISKNKTIDFEGISECDGSFYLINERVRHVIKVDEHNFSKLNIDFPEDVLSGPKNAGFEGIGIDCPHKILFIAKERNPRFLVKIDMNTLKVILYKDISLSNRAGQKIINSISGDGLLTISPDFSGLAFYNENLYVIERNTYEIAKINPDTLKVLSRVSFFFSLKNAYDTLEPFGLAEALFITPKNIIIGTDNNKYPLSHFFEKQYGIKGNFPSLFFFSKPKNF